MAPIFEKFRGPPGRYQVHLVSWGYSADVCLMSHYILFVEVKRRQIGDLVATQGLVTYDSDEWWAWIQQIFPCVRDINPFQYGNGPTSDIFDMLAADARSPTALELEVSDNGTIAFNRPDEATKPCTDCDGKGRAALPPTWESRPCETCAGTGEV